MRVRTVIASLLGLTSFAFVLVGISSPYNGWFKCNIIDEQNFTASYGYVSLTWVNRINSSSSTARQQYTALRSLLKDDGDNHLAADADRILTGGITAVSCAIPVVVFTLLGVVWSFSRGFSLSSTFYRYLPPLVSFLLAALLTLFGSVTFVMFVRTNESQEPLNSTLVYLSALAPFSSPPSSSFATDANLVRTADAMPSYAWALSMISVPLNVASAVLLWFDRKETQYETIP